MQGQKGTKIELGLLQKLNLADVDLCNSQAGPVARAEVAYLASTHVLKRIDASSSLLDLTPDNLRDQLGSKLSQVAGGGLPLDDLNHLLADSPDLRGLSVGGGLNLVRPLLGESDGEQTDKVVIGGLDGDVGLDQGLPLANHRSQLVGGEVQAVKVRQAVLALDLIDTEFNLAERVLLVFLEIGKGNLQDAPLQGIVGILETCSTVDKGLSDTNRAIRVPSALVHPAQNHRPDRWRAPSWVREGEGEKTEQ